MAIKLSELPMQADGSLYHINLKKEHLAGSVILVGDPGRVKIISSLFDKVEFERVNREIITNTGILNGKRISVMSTGMGPDNIDIVINELDAVVNIDFETRTIKDDKIKLDLIRIGTCGSVQADIPIETPIASQYGLGMDGLLHFYDTEGVNEEDINAAFVKHTHWPKAWPQPYIVESSKELMDKLAFDTIQGITCTAPGFYGPQGRYVRLPLAHPKMNDLIESFRFNELKITNLEMETSALYGLAKALGHNALTICLAIANRVDKTFSEDYRPHMQKLIETTLERLTK